MTKTVETDPTEVPGPEAVADASTLSGQRAAAPDATVQATVPATDSSIRGAAEDVVSPFLPLPPSLFRTSGEIAHGGMGRVVHAWDARLRRQVAIKELLTDSPDLRARFEREALITAGLQHPSIVNILEAGRFLDGKPFYVMKLVSGKPLDTVAAEATTFEARLGLVPKVIAVTDALAYAHSRRVIHRDLKPSNVLIGEFGEVVVIDWGLAKSLAEAEAPGPASAASEPSAAGETRVGAVMGTPAYMPPEQAAGHPVDERADVYALGAILYKVLAGDAPFAGTTSVEILRAVLAGAPPPLGRHEPRVPYDLVAIVDKAMARDPRQRYPTARELAEDLKRFQTGQLVASRRYTRWELVGRFVRRKLAILSVIALALVVLAVGGTYAIVRIVRARRVAEKARADALDEKHAADDAAAVAKATAADLQQGQGREALEAGRALADDGRHSHPVKLTAAQDYAKALPLEQGACQAGNAAACRDLGEMYDRGEAVAKDMAKALSLYHIASAGGDPRGCTDLGAAYQRGAGVAKDDAQAVALFQHACDAEDSIGCSNLGAMYYNGAGVTKDVVTAVALFRRGCSDGDADACLNLGTMYMNGTGVAQDIAQAIDLFSKPCAGGDGIGCFDLGRLYQYGIGVAPDIAQAIALYQKACDSGYGGGCNNLGLLYLGGGGAPADAVKAVGLFQQACDDGEVDGCTDLGTMYVSGQGVAKDLSTAVAVFTKACGRGSGMGCVNLGELYRDAQGVTPDPVKAVALFQEACDLPTGTNGQAAGCDDLAALYRDGKGVVKDLARAKALFAQACEGGHEEDCGK